MTEHISTILIVDDDLAGCTMMEGLLRSADYRIVCITAGQAALPTAQQMLPDLVLLNVMMPDLDGFEICRQLRDDPILAEVPIIMVTAQEDRQSRICGMEAGADDFVIKPIDRMELRACSHDHAAQSLSAAAHRANAAPAGRGADPPAQP